MADTKPPDYEKYTRGVAREAQDYNRRAIKSDRDAIGESRGFEEMARRNAIGSRIDPEYQKLEELERKSRRDEIRARTRAGRGDWTRSVSLRRSRRK